jgi:hypothetical protein
MSFANCSYTLKEKKEFLWFQEEFMLSFSPRMTSGIQFRNSNLRNNLLGSLLVRQVENWFYIDGNFFKVCLNYVSLMLEMKSLIKKQ